MLVHDALDRRPGERRLPRQHLVEHAPQRVQVAPPVEVPFSRSLLRTHVLHGVPTAIPVSVSLLAAGRADRPGDAEVGHHGVAALQQDVLRLDVAVNDAVAVGVAQRVGYLTGDLQRVVDGELFLAVQPIAQRFAFDVAA